MIADTNHNFFPVVNSNNHVTGFISAKDFLINPGSAIPTLIKPVCKFKEEDSTSDVLSKFKKYSTNFGVVTGNADELLGIVTIHDLGEALIGEFA